MTHASDVVASYTIETLVGSKRYPVLPLLEVAELNPRKLSCPPADDEMVSFVPMKAVEEESGRINTSEQRPWLAVRKGYTPFQNGDVIFAKITPCMENGKYAVATGLIGGRAAGSTEFHVLRPTENLDSKYLLYFLFRSDIRRNARQSMRGAAGQLRVPTVFFEGLSIPVPPLDKQRRIVAEIEEQLSRLEAGVAALKRVQANLKRYTSSVIASTFPCVGETLPAGWAWAYLSDLGELSRGKSKHRPRDDPKLYGGTYPFIQTGDVKASRGRIREFTQTYSEMGLAQSRLWPAGTLCITIAANIADTGILEFDSCFPDSVVGFRADSGLALTQYIERYLRSMKEHLDRLAPATAQKNINLEVLSKVQVPVPPPSIAQSMVEEVDRRLSVVDELETQVRVDLTRAERLRQACLSQAFQG
ncbi:MAG: restriction endonuclease subunit S [Rhodocyclales bacterium]|nr:MAG: restriction endonuclease subunit S [Rhodocyclales bacterium]